MTYHDHPTEAETGAPIPLKDAAERLGVSVSALRSRLKRGTLDSKKDEEGRILVYLPADGPAPGPIPEAAPEPDTEDAADAMVQDATGHTDFATPLNQLIEAIQCLHTDLGNHDAGLERLMSMHREQFETNSTLESRIQDMGRQIDAVHTALKTMGAAFRVHAQETDRLIKVLGRSGNGAPGAAAAQAPAFNPPTQKQRLFGRRLTDQDDTTTDAS